MILEQPHANLLRYLVRRGPLALVMALPWHREMADAGLVTIKAAKVGVVIDATPAGRDALAGFVPRGRGTGEGRRTPSGAVNAPGSG